MTFVATIWLASWSQNKRFDEINRRLNAIDSTLRRIEATIQEHGEKIARLEERTSPFGRR